MAIFNDLVEASPPLELGLNLVNAYRRGDPGTPIEFLYTAANTTMWLTEEMAVNATERWRVAYEKVWG